MQIARRDFQSAELTYSSLEKQLKMLGIESDSLTIDNLNGAFPVKSPWAGTIRNLGIQRGVYIRKGDVIGNIEETNRKYLKITVPEKAFLKVAAGDTMQSWPKYDSLAAFKSIVSYKEDRLDALTHTGTIYALIPEHLKLITGLSVRTKVRDNDKINVVVDKSAIFKEHDKTYVFSKYQGSVVKFPVKSMQTAEEKIRLINFPTKYADSIIISGTHLLNRRFTKP
jgi:hypothetical protein